MTARDALPFAVFGAFLLLFTVRARARGQSVREYLDARNRGTFGDPRPGWWRLPVAGAFVIWLIVAAPLGFSLVMIAAPPLVLAWIPLVGLVLRAYHRHRCDVAPSILPRR